LFYNILNMKTLRNTKKIFVENECIRNSGYPVRDRMLVEKIKPNPSFSTLFLIFLLWVIPFTMSGQRYISGRITDAGTGEPIIGASVFIANTTVGASTGADGNYRLAIPGEGSYRLAVSHVGYQPVFSDIEPGRVSLVFDAAMYANEMEEVTVAVRVRFRQRDINLFWEKILGRRPTKRTIHATNPETVYYYYNSETRILKVTCREPLQIVNNETGYQIQYVLNYFTHDYHTGVTVWDEQSVFTELEPENIQQKNIWEKNRKKVYQVSITKFIKSLYNNSLFDDGFVLLVPPKFGQLPKDDPFKSYDELRLLSPDSILSANSSGNSKTLNLSFDRMMLICYGRPLNDFDFVNLQLSHNYRRNWANNGLFRNLLSGDSIRIFPDGTYTNRMFMTPVSLSNTLMGLDKILPVEYIPDGSTLSAAFAENAHAPVCDFAGATQRFERQLYVFPQEKIHLHTDRDIYVPGEKIWFKAYVVDASTHQHSAGSRYVYVELIDSRNSLVNRAMIRPTDDMLFYGHLPLPETVSQGNYTLRAYTRYMENLGDDYFFKKNIRIGSLNRENGEKRKSMRSMENQKNQKNHINHSPDFDVSFFPEGGNLLEGVFCKVAFKAMNQNGYPETVSGKLVDETGKELASVATHYAGMGILGYLPERGKRIYLRCSNVNGLEKQFELPQPNPHAYSLTATLQGKSFQIGIQQSIHAPDISCYLLAHCRGELFYFSSWDEKNENLIFDEDMLPAGVIQLVLFDEQMNPLSERLVFSKNDDAIAKVEFQTDKQVYEKREKVIVALSPSPWGRAGEGLLSVAITDDNDFAIDSTTTILSSLLLSSELRGYIENPAYYLQDSTALDFLMMTHGWRRYNVSEALKGQPEYPQTSLQTAREISGHVKRLVLNKPVNDSEITILTKNGGVMVTTTDSKGLFVFQDFELPDSTDYFIQALRQIVKPTHERNDLVKLVVDKESFPVPVYAPQTQIPVTEAASQLVTKGESFRNKAELRALYDDNMRLIHLEEVVISAPRVRRYEPRQQFWANQNSDVTIRRKDIEKNSHLPYISDHLPLLAPGIRVTPNGEIYIRGTKRPLVLIDGLPVDWPDKPDLDHKNESPLERLPISMIESIDIFKTGAPFGMSGANGAISITTKRGNDSPRNDQSNFVVYTPLGYQKPVEFYSPKYETQEAKWTTIPDYRTTIFWKPDIVISDEEEASFEFYTSDFKTTYSVVIEGITADGRIVRQVEKIRVE